MPETTFAVDSDCFTINLPNGYTLAFEPCDNNGVPGYLQKDFKDTEHAKPQPQLRMIVTGNGTHVRHMLIGADEMALQIQSFAKMTKEEIHGRSAQS